MYEIEKNVAVPKQGRPPKYPWADMQPGDSFFVATDKQADVQSSLSSRAKIVLGSGNYRTAKVDGGVRLWRLA